MEGIFFGNSTAAATAAPGFWGSGVSQVGKHWKQTNVKTKGLTQWPILLASHMYRKNLMKPKEPYGIIYKWTQRNHIQKIWFWSHVSWNHWSLLVCVLMGLDLQFLVIVIYVYLILYRYVLDPSRESQDRSIVTHRVLPSKKKGHIMPSPRWAKIIFLPFRSRRTGIAS